MTLVVMLYGGFVCAIPAFSGIFTYEMLRDPEHAAIRELGKPVAAASPFVLFMNLYKESPRAWHDVPSLPFYVYHCMIPAVCLPVMWRLSRKLKPEYAAFSVTGAGAMTNSPTLNETVSVNESRSLEKGSPAKEVGS